METGRTRTSLGVDPVTVRTVLQYWERRAEDKDGWDKKYAETRDRHGLSFSFSHSPGTLTHSPTHTPTES